MCVVCERYIMGLDIDIRHCVVSFIYAEGEGDSGERELFLTFLGEGVKRLNRNVTKIISF